MISWKINVIFYFLPLTYACPFFHINSWSKVVFLGTKDQEIACPSLFFLSYTSHTLGEHQKESPKIKTPQVLWLKRDLQRHTTHIILSSLSSEGGCLGRREVREGEWKLGIFTGDWRDGEEEKGTQLALWGGAGHSKRLLGTTALQRSPTCWAICLFTIGDPLNPRTHWCICNRRWVQYPWCSNGKGNVEGKTLSLHLGEPGWQWYQQRMKENFSAIENGQPK